MNETNSIVLEDRKGKTLSDVVSVVILKIRTERTGMICPDRTTIFRSDLTKILDPERDIILKYYEST